MNNDISLVVTNTSTFVRGKLSKQLYQDLKKELGFLPEGARFRIKSVQANPKTASWSKDWDGRITTVCYNKAKCRCAIKKEGTHFPTGLLSRAIQFFKNNYITVKVYDKREKVAPSLSLSMSEEFELRDYQQKVIEDSLNVERGLIKMATGSGKSGVAASIIANLNVSPFIFYVTSLDLLNQARDELSRFIMDNGKSLEVGVIGGGKCDIKDVNVMTVQTAVRACGMKYKKFDDEDKASSKAISKIKSKDIKELILSAKGIIYDEVQHARAEMCQILSDMSINARYRYGMSATPVRDSGDDILIDACFGRMICDISASFLIRHPNKYLVKPNIYFVPVKNMRGRPFNTYATAYKEAIVQNAYRNSLIAKIAIGMKEDNKVILILCKQIEHGNILEKLIPGSLFLHGSHSSKVREAHLNKMRNREASITVSSVIFDEGINCRPLDTLILAGSGKSSTRALQRVGRALRPCEGKEEATVIDFEDHCKYMLAHSRRRKKMYQTEPEFNIDILNL